MSPLEVAGIAVGALLVGFLLGSWSWRGRAAAIERAEDRQAAERERLDRERLGLRDLLLARTPGDAVELERSHAAAERPPPPPAPPPIWAGDPRVKGFDPVVKMRNGVPHLQLRSGPPGSRVVHQEIPLDEFGARAPTTVTPTAPAR